MSQAWIITTDSRIKAIVDGLAGKFDKITAVVVGEAEVKGVDHVIRITVPSGVPVEATVPTVVDAIPAQSGDVVIARQGQAERVLGTAVATHLIAPVLVSVRDLSQTSATVGRYGGITCEDVEFEGPLVAILDGGGECEGAIPTEETVSGANYQATIVSEDVIEGESVNISAAKRLVAAGRGFMQEDDLGLARAFAKSIGAELACSRPLAEGNGWLSRETYVGISGQHVAPEIYAAVGISGQIQHTAGMSDSATVIAINKDENAAIFSITDYGIVGDLYEILPQLTKAIEA